MFFALLQSSQTPWSLTGFGRVQEGIALSRQTGGFRKRAAPLPGPLRQWAHEREVLAESRRAALATGSSARPPPPSTDSPLCQDCLRGARACGLGLGAVLGAEPYL